MHQFEGQKLRHRYREQMYGHQGGKAGGGGGGGGAVMNWEIGIYTLICIKWITNKNLLYIKKETLFKYKDTYRLKANEERCAMLTLIKRKQEQLY